ncbi:MAG TPA: sortase [Candidatus Saccharimonadia bacterium]|nr:sortase [Candidatus Saccharimonadia bacterium]
MSKKTTIVTIFGAALLLAGGFLLATMMRNQAVNIVATPPVAASVRTSSVTNTGIAPTEVAPLEGYVSGTPTSLNIPSLNMYLPVVPGYYDASSQTWTLTTTKVQFATTSSLPNNQSGNTFIYGHARTNLFGSLPKIQAGAEAIVATSNGHHFFYTLNNTKVIDPSNYNTVFGYRGKPVLMLQTCVGLLYQSREILTFNLEKVV